MSIVELNMTKRTTDILLSNGIDTIEKLTLLTNNKVIKLRNLGRLSLLELLDKMKELKLEFADDPEYIL